MCISYSLTRLTRLVRPLAFLLLGSLLTFSAPRAISIPVLDKSKVAEAASPITGIQPMAPLKAARPA